MPAAAKNPVDLTFRAFADPTRLRILNLIQDGELCVCDLVAVLDLPQPTVSRHLSYLRRAGLVRARQERSWNFYELAPARTPFHSKMLECLATCYVDVPEMTQDRARARKLRSRGGCCPP
jgi:ArsR family transcriptional regulator, arsenate/arsenite/antimonite-responsive transcriptional repressor